MPTRLDLYKRQRRRFAGYVYALTLFFGLIALLQWYLIWYFAEAHHFFKSKYWVSIMLFAFALLGTTFFIFFEDLRFIIPINWIIALLIVESLILSLSVLVVRQTDFGVIVYFLSCSLAIIIFILIGSFMPHDLTLDVVILFVLAVIGLIGAVYFLMLHIVGNIEGTFYAHWGFIAAVVVMFVMYHAQIINGGRFAEMRVADTLLGALILFYDLFLLYMYTFFLAPRWSDPCDVHKNETVYLEFRHAPLSNYYIAADPKKDLRY